MNIGFLAATHPKRRQQRLWGVAASTLAVVYLTTACADQPAESTTKTVVEQMNPEIEVVDVDVDVRGRKVTCIYVNGVSEAARSRTPAVRLLRTPSDLPQPSLPVLPVLRR